MSTLSKGDHMAEQIDKLLTQQQVMDWTGMSRQYFEIARHRGTSMPYIKIGKSVRYRTSDVQKWINDHAVCAGI